MKFKFYLVLLIIWIEMGCQPQPEVDSEVITTDLMVVGGGASGFTAAIQAARLGKKVLVLEETPWLGGMLTSAGVSAIDGNHRLPGGLWGEFRQKLYDHYGGPGSLATGWVSNTLFEPHVGHEVISEMIAAEENITVKHGWYLQEAIVKNNQLTGAIFENSLGQKLEVNAIVSIDATEYGDLMAMSGADYFIGLDPRSRTEESLAPQEGLNYIQDLTYVAILKDYGQGTDRTIEEPEDYNPDIFLCACADLCADTTVTLSCEQMLDYGKLPNDKYMINWPNEGNDYYTNSLEMTHEERREAFEEAKLFTLQFVYFIQNELGYKHLGLADDEFDTPDLMPYIPYHRESRRLDGLVMFTVNDMLYPYRNELYKTGIAVGDYPLDHHRDKNPAIIEITFPSVPSFTIPWGVMIPKSINGLIVAEKSISVSSLANGSTRLQPVVMLIGQAAGATAALAIDSEVPVQMVLVREVQEILLENDNWLLPFVDIQPDSSYFDAIQRIGASGVIKGDGVPEAWANRTYIYPDSIMSTDEIKEGLQVALKKNEFLKDTSVFEFIDTLTTNSVENLHRLLQQIDTELPTPDTPGFSVSGNDPLDRKTFALLVDAYLDPFNGIKLTE